MQTKQERIESMVQWKINHSSTRVNLGNFNRQLKELGCGAEERRAIRARIREEWDNRH